MSVDCEMNWVWGRGKKQKSKIGLVKKLIKLFYIWYVYDFLLKYIKYMFVNMILKCFLFVVDSFNFLLDLFWVRLFVSVFYIKGPRSFYWKFIFTFLFSMDQHLVGKCRLYWEISYFKVYKVWKRLSIIFVRQNI